MSNPTSNPTSDPTNEALQAEMKRDIESEIHAHLQLVNACDTNTPEQQKAQMRVRELGEELNRLNKLPEQTVELPDLTEPIK